MTENSNKNRKMVEEVTSHGELAGVEAELLEAVEGGLAGSPEITVPFDPKRIKFNTETPVIELILRRIGRDEIDMMPDFQRRVGIWNLRRKSRLIESVLLRIPLPVFYVAADENDNWQVIDGLQRLDTFRDFVRPAENGVGFRLDELEYLTQFNGCNFSSLPRAMQRRIEETSIYVHIIQPDTPPAVMFNIFKRINTGGMPLSSQEIRHAVNPGPAREFLKTLADSEEFLTATAHGIKDERMAARECVLRFIAFFLTPPQEYVRGDLDTFLSQTMQEVNRLPANKRKRIKTVFHKAMRAATDIFGRYAFRKMYARQGWRNPINRAIFESWSVNLANLNDVQRQCLVERRDCVVDGFIQLMQEDDRFVVAVSQGTGQPERIKHRFAAIHKLIEQVLK